MRKRIGRLITLAALLCSPSAALAQYYEVPPSVFTGPLSHPRYEEGGFYAGFGGMYWKTNRTLASQSIAKRGFLDVDGSILGKGPNTFEGSGQEALNTNQLMGPSNWQTGWDLHVGWRFSGALVIELNWKHLSEVNYHASASILPPDFNVGAELQNTFLFSPVMNFPPEFAGNPRNLPQGNPGATYGIWNAASLMQTQFTQRFDIYGLNVRFPTWQTDNYRHYGLFGPRIVWIWERFNWRTVSTDVAGVAGSNDVAMYSNTVSNRMYGFHAGFGNDWYMGTNPLGAWSVTLDLEVGLYANPAKVRAAYELGDRSIAYTRGRRFATIVPSLEGRIAGTWYPWEAISISFGYDLMMFFNTIASPKPIDFNVGLIDPQYEHVFFRWYNGFTLGISFVF